MKHRIASVLLGALLALGPQWAWAATTDGDLAAASGGLAAPVENGGSTAPHAKAALHAKTAPRANSASRPNTEPKSPKSLRYQGHVDSPKVAWDGGLTLVAGPKPLEPLQDTVNWLHRAYSGNQPWYYFTIPDEPALSFLGKPGEHVYWGLPSGAQGEVSLWIGYGAETDIPVENFRDQVADLEIVGFDGPGRMDLFQGGTEGYPLVHMLSSHDPAVRSTPVTAGTHTHPNTTFTKPGRYSVTYRASARGKDGSVLRSEPQTVEWQVGGTSPLDADAASVARAWQAAPKGQASGSVLRLSPAVSDAGEPLTAFDFSTGNAADSGQVAFFIDGYFLAQVPVVGGTARYLEMVGAGSSSFQAVYLPGGSADSASNSTGAFVTDAVKYVTGQAETSATGVGEFPKPTPQQPAPKYDSGLVEATDAVVHMQAKQDGEHTVITVEPADPRVRMNVVGGWGTDLEDALASCPIQFTSAPGARSLTVDTEFITDGCSTSTAHFRLTPDSRMSLGGADISGEGWEFSAETKLPGKVTTTAPEPKPEPNPAPDPEPGPGEKPNPAPDTETEPGAESEPGTETDPGSGDSPNPAPGADSESGSGENSNTAPGHKPEPAPSPTPNPAPAPTPTPTPDVNGIYSNPVTLNRGHVDFGPVWTGSELRMVVGDDTRTAAKGSVHRAPESVKLAANLRPYKRDKRHFADTAYNFLGRPGTQLYVLPQNQVEGIVWPGFSTENLPADRFPNGSQLLITPRSAPAGAKWLAFTAGPFGFEKMHASSAGASTITASGRLHMHLNWAFTKPGTYEVDVVALAVGADGKQYRSEPGTYRFDISDSTRPGANAGTNPGSNSGANPGTGGKPGSNPGGSDNSGDGQNAGSDQNSGTDQNPGGDPNSGTGHNSGTDQSGKKLTIDELVDRLNGLTASDDDAQAGASGGSGNAGAAPSHSESGGSAAQTEETTGNANPAGSQGAEASANSVANDKSAGSHKSDQTGKSAVPAGAPGASGEAKGLPVLAQQPSASGQAPVLPPAGGGGQVLAGPSLSTASDPVVPGQDGESEEGADDSAEAAESAENGDESAAADKADSSSSKSLTKPASAAAKPVPAARAETGTPLWQWILLGVGVLAVGGAAGFLLMRRR